MTTIVQPVPRTHEAPTAVPRWRTVVWDDPVNLMSYVSAVFREYFGYSALACGGREDLNDRNASIDPVAFACVRERGSRRRIARDHQGFDSARSQFVEGRQRQ